MATASVVEMQKINGAAEGPKVELVRVIKASKRQVFDAWTKPQTIRRWFCPGTITIADVSMDPRLDGAWLIETTNGCQPDGAPVNQNSVVTGRYLRVDPYDVLAFTWKRSADPQEESLVTITLRDVEGGTEMKLVHERFLTEASRDRHQTGWESVLEKLAEFLGA
jgi:uncharacterized protein YndB with AHSA1/START domain